MGLNYKKHHKLLILPSQQVILSYEPSAENNVGGGQAEPSLSYKFSKRNLTQLAYLLNRHHFEPEVSKPAALSHVDSIYAQTTDDDI